jgi:hypothetical protein
MKRWIGIFAVLLIFISIAFAEDIVYETDGRGRLTGKVMRLEEGATIEVTGTVTATVDTSDLADSTRQDSGLLLLDSIDGKITAVDTGDVTVTTLPAITGTVDVGTVTTLPAITGTVDVGTVTTLPAGLADTTRQDSGLLLLEQFKFDGDNLKVKLSEAINVETLNVEMDTTNEWLGRLFDSTNPETGYAVQPATGTTWAMTASALPLPASAATEASLASVADFTKQISDAVNSDSEVDVNVTNASIAVTGAVDVGTVTTLPAITGTVDVGTVTTLPAITGTVDVGTVTTLPAITGTVDVGTVTTLPAITGTVDVGTVTTLPAITGTVDVGTVTTLPAITGTVKPAAVSGEVLTADGQISASAGVVYAVYVSGITVTAGDKVEIKNSADNSGDSLVTIVADGANGAWTFCPAVGITFDTGIYVDETKASGGTFTVTVVYE